MVVVKQCRHPHNIRFVSIYRLEEFFRSYISAQVDYLEPRSFKHHTDKVFSNFMKISFYCTNDHFA